MVRNRTNYRVSRAALYEDSEEEISEGEYVPTKIEFDIIEVDNDESEKPEVPDNEPQEEDEFAFPLFSLAPSASEDNKQVMKVSLKNAPIDEIRVERPDSYYFVSYTTEERNIFTQSAVSYETIIGSMPTLKDWQPWKVVDLKEYNSQFDNIKKARKRAGKKKRENKVESRKRKEERKKQIKQKEKEKEKLLKKKMFHKRGGKKHKKKPEATKPVYRTE